jgi:hypothetical protein
MTAEELIVEVRKCGAVPLLIDGKLRVAPPGKLPADLKNLLCRRASEIKAVLTKQSPGQSCDETHRSECGRPPARITGIVPDSRHPLVNDLVRAKIEAIETEARQLGWPAELLWSRVYWDLPRGLAAILEADDEIGEVTPEYIEVLKFRRDIERFMRRVA